MDQYHNTISKEANNIKNEMTTLIKNNYISNDIVIPKRLEFKTNIECEKSTKEDLSSTQIELESKTEFIHYKFDKINKSDKSDKTD